MTNVSLVWKLRLHMFLTLFNMVQYLFCWWCNALTQATPWLFLHHHAKRLCLLASIESEFKHYGSWHANFWKQFHKLHMLQPKVFEVNDVICNILFLDCFAFLIQGRRFWVLWPRICTGWSSIRRWSQYVRRLTTPHLWPRKEEFSHRWKRS